MAEKADGHFSAYGYQPRKEWQRKKPLAPPQYKDQSQQGNQHPYRQQHPSYQTYKRSQTKWRSVISDNRKPPPLRSTTTRILNPFGSYNLHLRMTRNRCITSFD
ncbi:hypothetical protein Hamer_G009987 [Homarus americanus]|uniref:Uncharacterized protein n=1 Tax=Homarus americanus TaxID=6706 RepID=A0A8J5JMF7_HOMAM|nr:hypothetical protein Hamer_G009987 [Homarus americanus]